MSDHLDAPGTTSPNMGPRVDIYVFGKLDHDPTNIAGYRNGRKLTDDVIDARLAVLTNGSVTTDKAGPHRDLLTTFPYLRPPH
jgi:hypothetical protein